MKTAPINRTSIRTTEVGIEGYAFNPRGGRSSTATELANDLDKHQIPLDVDTVRKWLKEAAELLPPK